jgi:hypothetical protein
VRRGRWPCHRAPRTDRAPATPGVHRPPRRPASRLRPGAPPARRGPHPGDGDRPPVRVPPRHWRPVSRDPEVLQFGHERIPIAGRAQRDARGFVVRGEDRPGPVGAEPTVEFGRPPTSDVRSCAPGSRPGPARRPATAATRRLSQRAQDPVHEPRRPWPASAGTCSRASDTHVSTAARGGTPVRKQLQRPEPQDTAQRRLHVRQGTGQHLPERPVERALPPQGVVREVRRERSVLLGRELTDRGRDREVRPGTVLLDGRERAERRPAGRQTGVAHASDPSPDRRAVRRPAGGSRWRTPRRPSGPCRPVGRRPTGRHRQRRPRSRHAW